MSLVAVHNTIGTSMALKKLKTRLLLKRLVIHNKPNNNNNNTKNHLRVSNTRAPSNILILQLSNTRNLRRYNNLKFSLQRRKRLSLTVVGSKATIEALERSLPAVGQTKKASVSGVMTSVKMGTLASREHATRIAQLRLPMNGSLLALVSQAIRVVLAR